MCVELCRLRWVFMIRSLADQTTRNTSRRGTAKEQIRILVFARCIKEGEISSDSD